MAEIENGSAAPPVPAVQVAPDAVERQSVPVSALDLGIDVAKEIKAEETRLRGAGSGLPEKGPTGPAATPPAPAAAPTGPTGPTSATTPTPPAPAATPTGPSGPAAATEKPAKVKIGGKEYTVEELEKELAKRQAPPAAVAPAEPAPPAPKEPNKEEIAQAESTWCQELAKNEGIKFNTTPDEFETILSGGKEAVELFERKLTDTCTRAIMLARKSIYSDLNPQLAQFSKALQPLTVQQVELERIATEQAFSATYPEYLPHADTAKSVAEALVKSYPKEVEKMTRDQFMQEVAAQTDRILQTEYKRWNPNATGTWRDAAKAAPAATTPPAAPATPPTPAPTPAAAAAPVVAPPAANSPAATA